MLWTVPAAAGNQWYPTSRLCGGLQQAATAPPARHGCALEDRVSFVRFGGNNFL